MFNCLKTVGALEIGDDNSYSKDLIFNKNIEKDDCIALTDTLKLHVTNPIPSYEELNDGIHVSNAIFVGSENTLKNLDKFLDKYNACIYRKTDLIDYKDFDIAFIFDKKKFIKDAENVTAENIGDFIKNLLDEKRVFTYDSITCAAYVAALAGMHAVDSSKHGGLTGFQASFIGSLLFRELRGIKGTFYVVKVEDLYWHGTRDQNDEDNPLYELTHPELGTQKEFVNKAITSLFDDRNSYDRKYTKSAPMSNLTTFISSTKKAINVLNQDFSEFKLLDFTLNDSDKNELNKYIESKLKTVDSRNKISDLLIANKAIPKYIKKYGDTFKDEKYPILSAEDDHLDDRKIAMKGLRKLIKKYNLNIVINKKQETEEVNAMVENLKEYQLQVIKENNACCCAG